MYCDMFRNGNFLIQILIVFCFGFEVEEYKYNECVAGNKEHYKLHLSNVYVQCEL